jgi:hypothetical protein
MALAGELLPSARHSGIRGAPSGPVCDINDTAWPNGPHVVDVAEVNPNPDPDTSIPYALAVSGCHK